MQTAGAHPTGISVESTMSGPPTWYRVREVIVTVAAIMGGLGVLIAGMTYAVQPVSDHIRLLREDVQILQGTAADVRERLATLEVMQTNLEEGQANLEARLVKLEEGQANLEARMMKLEEGQIRILALLERGGVPGTSR